MKLKKKRILEYEGRLRNSVTPLNIMTFISQKFQKNKREKMGQKKIFVEIIAENFPNLGKEIDIQI